MESGSKEGCEGSDWRIVESGRRSSLDVIFWAQGTRVMTSVMVSQVWLACFERSGCPYGSGRLEGGREGGGRGGVVRGRRCDTRVVGSLAGGEGEEMVVVEGEGGGGNDDGRLGIHSERKASSSSQGGAKRRRRGEDDDHVVIGLCLVAGLPLPPPKTEPHNLSSLTLSAARLRTADDELGRGFQCSLQAT